MLRAYGRPAADRKREEREAFGPYAANYPLLILFLLIAALFIIAQLWLYRI